MFHVLQVLVPIKRMFTFTYRSFDYRLINEPCLSQCPSRKYYFVVVQLTIEIYSLPVSTANGIKFSFIKMSDRDLKFVYLFCRTDTFLFVIENPIRKCKHLLSSSIYKHLKTYLIKHKQSLILGECESQLISVLSNIFQF
jgi:hypothetical protein